MNDMIKAGGSFITALFSYVTGNQISNMMKPDLQEQITFHLQCIAFAVTIIAGLFSIYFAVRKLKKESKK